MSTNLHEFELNLSRFTQGVPHLHGVMVKKVAFTILRKVVQKTPVDTGRARANWSVSLGDPPTSVKHDEDPVGGSTIEAGSREIHRSNPGSEVIWIGNNLDYIEALENGHSKQSPHGMLKLTLEEIVNGLR